jgi:hypothetical protein
MAILDTEGIEHLLRQGRESYTGLLDMVVRDYRALEARREEAREAVRRVNKEVGFPQSDEDRLRYYAAHEALSDAEFDTDWQLRVNRNACEQLRSALKEEIQYLRRSLDQLEKEAGELGERAKNSLPRPHSEPSTQQSSRVREQASRLLSVLRQGFHV